MSTTRMDDEPRSPTPHNEADDDPHPNPPNAPSPPHTPPHTQCAFDLLDPDALVTEPERANLRAQLEHVAAHLNVPGSVRVCLVNDARMTDEHGRYSGIATTTDVLTFDLSDSQSELDADLFVCVDEAHRAAALRNHNPTLELLLYIIHGTLHCLGHNDQDPDSFKRMHAREDEILTAIGLEPVFAPTPTQDTNP